MVTIHFCKKEPHQHSADIFVFDGGERKSYVWNNMRLSKWWRVVDFGWTIPLMISKLNIHAINKSCVMLWSIRQEISQLRERYTVSYPTVWFGEQLDVQSRAVSWQIGSETSGSVGSAWRLWAAGCVRPKRILDVCGCAKRHVWELVFIITCDLFLL